MVLEEQSGLAAVAPASQKGYAAEGKRRVPRMREALRQMRFRWRRCGRWSGQGCRVKRRRGPPRRSPAGKSVLAGKRRSQKQKGRSDRSLCGRAVVGRSRSKRRKQQRALQRRAKAAGSAGTQKAKGSGRRQSRSVKRSRSRWWSAAGGRCPLSQWHPATALFRLRERLYIRPPFPPEQRWNFPLRPRSTAPPEEATIPEPCRNCRRFAARARL